MRQVNPVLQEKLAQVVSALGFEWVGCEQQPMGRQVVLRLYIDAPQGVSADDCMRVSHQVSGMLAVDDPFQGQYTLEVSSPGIDRPLFTLAQCERQVGSEVKVRSHQPVDGRRQFRGQLLNVEGEALHVQLPSGEVVVLPFADIDKANVIGKVTF
jgi:ribosome maturation factor RimP